MKTHYWVLWLACIINFIMALSLNSFSNSAIYLPALFLYFLSNLSTFIERFVSYRDSNLLMEQGVSFVCCILSGVMVFLYVANSLNFWDIQFKEDCGIYHILIQGVAHSFFTFNSMDITMEIFVAAFIMPAAYVALCVAPYLRNRGYTIKIIRNILVEKIWNVVTLIGISVGIGILSRVVCDYKYKKEYEGYGTPQYSKYFIVFFVVSLFVGLILLIRYNKDTLEKTEQEGKIEQIVNEPEINIS